MEPVKVYFAAYWVKHHLLGIHTHTHKISQTHIHQQAIRTQEVLQREPTVHGVSVPESCSSISGLRSN